MRIISIILLVIGLIVCSIGSLGIVYALTTSINDAMRGESGGIAMIAWGLNTSRILSYVNLFGCAIIFLGIVLNIISMFTGKKQQQQQQI